MGPKEARDADAVRRAYLAAQVPLWFGSTFSLPPNGSIDDPAWRISLGRELGRLPAVQNLVRQAAATCSLAELLERFARQLGIDERYPFRFRVLLLESLLALIGHARGPGGQPWVQLRIQIWLRELKRMVASVTTTPELLHSDDLDPNDGDHHLPVVHCRDCGATGWTSTLLHQDASQLDPSRNLRNFYRAFFGRDPLVRYVFPLRPLVSEAATAAPFSSEERVFCLDCLTIQEPSTKGGERQAPEAACQRCSSHNLLVVEVPDCTIRDRNNHLKSSSDCPYCSAHQSLLLIGASAASLTSNCSSSLFASSFNGDRKLIAFSDSVQDAAHRAGFIAARAYRTSFRTALTRTVQRHGQLEAESASAPLDLPALQNALLDQWRRELPDPVDFVATFLPSDLEWLREWSAIEQSARPTLAPDDPLLEIVERRLRWEVMAEFGYRSRLGSSVEQAGALAAGIRLERLESLLPELVEQLRNEVEPLRGIDQNSVQRFLLGFLHHLRQRGALPVPEILGADGQGSRYLASGGDDTYSFWLTTHLPNIGPSSNKPIFLTSSRGRGHFEQLASPRGRPTWAMHWLSKCLGDCGTPELQQVALEAIGGVPGGRRDPPGPATRAAGRAHLGPGPNRHRGGGRADQPALQLLR